MRSPETTTAHQTILYEYFVRKLASGGIKRQEFERLKKFPIGHNSVEGFVKLNITVGNLDWRGDTLIVADRRLTLKLTRSEEKRLRNQAEKLGLSARELAVKLITGKLSLPKED